VRLDRRRRWVQRVDRDDLEASELAIEGRHDIVRRADVREIEIHKSERLAMPNASVAELSGVGVMSPGESNRKSARGMRAPTSSRGRLARTGPDRACGRAAARARLLGCRVEPAGGARGVGSRARLLGRTPQAARSPQGASSFLVCHDTPFAGVLPGPSSISEPRLSLPRAPRG